MHSLLGSLLITASIIATANAQTVAPAVTKICSPFVVSPDAWRSITPVPDTTGNAWSVADCLALTKAIGGKWMQLGCLFEQDQGTPHLKYSFGDPLAVGDTPSPAQIPNPNCKWFQ
jgi:hypothetical protein